MQMTLLKIFAMKEPTQRKSLFKMTYKVNGKICRVLVDSSSKDNISSIEMVDKLKLTRIPHPYPYKGSWLTKDKKTLVNEQVLVEFNIG